VSPNRKKFSSPACWAVSIVAPSRVPIVRARRQMRHPRFQLPIVAAHCEIASRFLSSEDTVRQIGRQPSGSRTSRIRFAFACQSLFGIGKCQVLRWRDVANGDKKRRSYEMTHQN
jgi:hypothetical protein